MKINTTQIVSDCSFVQYFSMCFPFYAITNRTRDQFVSIQALLRHNEYRKADYKKKVTLPAKKPLNALCEKRLQSSMFKWTSFYNFLEFHCKILNSYAITQYIVVKKMVKNLNCNLYAKKSYGTLSKGVIFFGQPCI